MPEQSLSMPSQVRSVASGTPTTEICADTLDNDCDGQIDEAPCQISGSIGIIGEPIELPEQCSDIDGDDYSSEGGLCGALDCNDKDIAINPGAAEICDQIDNDCDDIIERTSSCFFCLCIEQFFRKGIHIYNILFCVKEHQSFAN